MISLQKYTSVTMAFSIAAGLMLTAAGQAAHAAYPDKPIRIVIPFAPGGPSDVLGRAIAQKLNVALGQPVLADNKPGAGTNLAAEHVARAAPDGYTLLLMMVGTQAINEAMYSKLAYNTVRDFAPITLTAASSLILAAHPSVPAKNLKELVALSKANPTKFNYGTAGAGTPLHLGGLLFNNLAGTDFQHVPYKGAAPAMNAVLAGEVSMFCGPITQGLAHVKGGKLKAIGVTGSSISGLVPELPTLSTTIPGLVVSSTYMVYAPPATPANIAQLIKTDLRKTWEDKDVRERLGAMGMDLIWLEGAELTRRVDADLAKWSNVVKTAGIRAD